MGSYATETVGAATVKVYTETANPDVQVTREHRATAETLDSWTVTTTGAASRVAADVTRVSLKFFNESTTAVRIRPDSTIPTTSVAAFYEIPAGGLYEVDVADVELAWSVAGRGSSTGALQIWKGTAA